MMLHTTKRLFFRPLAVHDFLGFIDLMTNPAVMNPIPLPAMSSKESVEHLHQLINEQPAGKQIMSVVSQDQQAFVGIAALLTNDEGDLEIAYRLREQYWGHGFGTEVAKGLLDLAFQDPEVQKITADVNSTNGKSIKILQKWFTFDRSFYNEEDQCTDRRYWLMRADYCSS